MYLIVMKLQMDKLYCGCNTLPNYASFGAAINTVCIVTAQFFGKAIDTADYWLHAPPYPSSYSYLLGQLHIVNIFVCSFYTN